MAHTEVRKFRRNTRWSGSRSRRLDSLLQVVTSGSKRCICEKISCCISYYYCFWAHYHQPT